MDDLFASFEPPLVKLPPSDRWFGIRERLRCRVCYLPQAINPAGSIRVVVTVEAMRCPTIRDSVTSTAIWWRYLLGAISFTSFRLILPLKRLICARAGSCLAATPASEDPHQLVGRPHQPGRIYEGAAITADWLESAASGAAVIGSAPRTDEFARSFAYEGFVYELKPPTTARTQVVLDAVLMDPHDEERRALVPNTGAPHACRVSWRHVVEACGV